MASAAVRSKAMVLLFFIHWLLMLPLFVLPPLCVGVVLSGSSLFAKVVV